MTRVLDQLDVLEAAVPHAAPRTPGPRQGRRGVRGPEWHTDPYFLSPGPKSLRTLFDAEHGLGGVAGYDVAETTDEDPERVSAVQRLTWAYLRSERYPGDSAWQAARDELTTGPGPLGRVETK
ncbi:hypothetical protein [Streptomyces sp. NPDC058812]|uniref:hypothetical protein n=1 Tax=unclassified Streptomyces TaxID=2593676 RepID=UPI00367AD99C